MSKIENSVLEKQYGKLITTQVISFQDKDFFGDEGKHIIEFDIYDGFAYCGDYEGRELFLTYPKLDFVNSCNEMKTSIKEFMGLNDTDPITVTDILQSYCTIGEI